MCEERSVHLEVRSRPEILGGIAFPGNLGPHAGDSDSGRDSVRTLIARVVRDLLNGSAAAPQDPLRFVGFVRPVAGWHVRWGLELRNIKQETTVDTFSDKQAVAEIMLNF